MLECADGMLLGANGKPRARTIFSGTFTYIRQARTFVRQARTETTRVWTECKRAQALYKRAQRNINRRERYGNGHRQEKNRRPRNHDGRGQNHNGQGLEKCWLLHGSMRTQYNNFLQDMHLQEENIIEKQKSKRKKLVDGGRIYLLIFIQKICNTFS
jgi:hypothetical protein